MSPSDKPDSRQLSNINILPEEVPPGILELFATREDQIRRAGLWQSDLESLKTPLAQVLARFPMAVGKEETLQVYGRLVKIHDFGPLIFAVLQQGSDTIELKLDRKRAGHTFELWKQNIRLGDIIVASGLASPSKHGNSLIEVHRFSVLAICAMPPEMFLLGRQTRLPKAKINVHTRMINDPGEVLRFEIRSRALKALRKCMTEEGFQEQITPILTQSFHGGRSHPFITHSRTRNEDLYLRLTSEIALKMLLTGGISRLYEIGPSFRNESEDALHILGFTQLEACAAYTSFDCMLAIFERLVTHTLSEVEQYLIESRQCSAQPHFPDVPIGAFARVPAREALLTTLGIDFRTKEGLHKMARACKRDLPKTQEEEAHVIYLALERFVYPELDDPTFLVELPAGLSPLVAKHPNDDALLQRAFAIVNGIKIAEIFFSEQSPKVQAMAMQKQIEQWLSLSNEVKRDYRGLMHAALCGMPPVSVMALGIERLFMILTDESDIRNIQLDL